MTRGYNRDTLTLLGIFNTRSRVYFPDKRLPTGPCLSNTFEMGYGSDSRVSDESRVSSTQGEFQSPSRTSRPDTKRNPWSVLERSDEKDTQY